MTKKKGSGAWHKKAKAPVRVKPVGNPTPLSYNAKRAREILAANEAARKAGKCSPP